MATVRLRPTLMQGVARGGSFGLALGCALAVVMVLAKLARFDAAPGGAGWLLIILPVLVGLIVGAVLGAALGRGEGVDVDGAGIHRVPGPPGGVLAWQSIEDLRTERVGGRTHLTVCLNSGATIRMAAPYDGRMLAADPGFERKLFMLRNLWETKRGLISYDQPDPRYRSD